jgi:hypothetical protein
VPNSLFPDQAVLELTINISGVRSSFFRLRHPKPPLVVRISNPDSGPDLLCHPGCLDWIDGRNPAKWERLGRWLGGRETWEICAPSGWGCGKLGFN